MTIEAIASYERYSKRGDNRLYSRWDYHGKYRFPDHPQHRQLLDAYNEACLKHEKAIGVLQFAIKRRHEPGFLKTEQTEKEIEKCQIVEKEAQEAVSQAARELTAFLDQSPNERISLLQSEIDELQTQLEQAQKAEFEFTQAMLNDPEAARTRLERIVQGYKGEQAEYSPQQLAELRSLKSQVESLKSKIYTRRRDIQIIHDLVAEEEKKAKVKSRMEEVLPAFTEVCVSFEKALNDLLDAANECDIRLYTGNIKIPKTATFKEPTYSYENGNIYFEF